MACPCSRPCCPRRCKVHKCLRNYMKELRESDPCYFCPTAPTRAIADLHGNFLDRRRRCTFPWSQYLFEQWLCPGNYGDRHHNACGMHHTRDKMKPLPRFIKPKETKAFSKALPCNDCGKIKPNADVNVVTLEDVLVCQEFQKLRKQRFPIIWIYGHPQGEDCKTIRDEFCHNLAETLGFKYINLDDEIQRWVDQLFHHTKIDELLQASTAMKRLANMTVQLMQDEELHLNLAGAMEMVKIILMAHYGSLSEEEGKALNGFIIDDFPCSEAEALAFEDLFYPVSMGIYFKIKARSQKKRCERDIPFEVDPIHFRRDESDIYVEEEVEKVVDLFEGRSLKVLNMEALGEKETSEIICIVKDVLLVTDDGKVPRMVKCKNPHCDCFGKPPGDKPLVYNCSPDEPQKECVEAPKPSIELDFIKSLFSQGVMGPDGRIVLRKQEGGGFDIGVAPLPPLTNAAPPKKAPVPVSDEEEEEEEEE